MQRSFVINDRFQIVPSNSTISDKVTGSVIRLEPRLMQVLCLLVETPGQTVTRQTLIDKVWNNYPGGDEALTQTVSALRKALIDDRKELLQTVPKKGYVFEGTITDGTAKTFIKTSRKFLMIPVTLTILAVVALVWFAVFQKDQRSVVASGPIAYPSNLDSLSQAEETPLNSVETKGPDGTYYKMVAIGDRPPAFYINGQRISEDNWEKHMPLINFLKKEIKARKRPSAPSSAP
ncbi:DNA-binding winged helix-turn-helix (wHTH) domain-containing protein [Dyadobacter soli]|uniref:DNA-binding winged helix-turn-helix (WHTH) domain-containing protein n=1 Tax=Dyadobacter soli TaxID=659014 RepID=A0A1G7LX28_9BACT|nr:winged helix-turn-helix domain-containing protein [Dyadobacter soli]SDF54065.1 DNA-binding winged helix-turn-helix (wHTH) domain-containing protein [Dyadobacter soli]